MSDNQIDKRLAVMLKKQRSAFYNDGTPDLETRLDRLRRLEAMLLTHENLIIDTLSEDFQGRSQVLSRAADIVGGITAIRYTMDNLEDWMAPQQVALPPFVEESGTHAEVRFSPLGVVGAIIPWNGPFLLSCLALTGILGAGNRAMIKPSEFAPASSRLLTKLLAEAFDETEVAVVEGAADTAAAFTRLPFNHLLFTGSTGVARHVMRAAAENLVPVTLELGGKSPVIIGKTANITQTVSRLTVGKVIFGGQVCVTPDYVLAPDHMIPSLADSLLSEVTELYPTIQDNDDYTAIINDAHMERLTNLVDDARAKGGTILTAHHGDNDDQGSSRKFPLTIILNVREDMAVMQEEIFGPVLPILPYSSVDDALDYIRRRPKPLSAYYFGEDVQEQEKVLQSIDTGGLVVNDVVCQIYYEAIPFGGTGESGMGRYRGHQGFKTFSNAKSVLVQKQPEEMLKMQRPPYGPGIHGYLDTQIENFRKK